MKCLCGSEEARLLFRSGWYDLVRCTACQQVRTESQGIGKRKTRYRVSDIAVYREKEEMFRQLFRRVVTFIQRFVPAGRLVDIGAGVGLLVDEARKVGFDAIGFEPSKAAVVAARDRFGIALEKYPFTSHLVPKPVNVVVVNHVLEHLSHPDKLMKEITQVLGRNGLLVIGVPNFGSIMARLKKARWQSLIPDQHCWHFTLPTLDQLVLPYSFMRQGCTMENHDRSMHPLWKQPVYAVLDTIALATGKGEAMLVAYKKL